jgi:hypothetical protein
MIGAVPTKSKRRGVQARDAAIAGGAPGVRAAQLTYLNAHGAHASAPWLAARSIDPEAGETP